MPTVYDYTDPHISIYCPVPPVAGGICEVCHSSTNVGFDQCLSCERTLAQVSRPISLVVPISLYRVGGQLHHVLWNYKNGPEGPSRDRHRLQIAATLARFINSHRGCIVAAAGEDWEALTIVPSSRSRSGRHPLEEVLRLAPPMWTAYIPTLEKGSEPIDHNTASDAGYTVPRDLAGRKLLLIDDTFTSGARVQSAVSALQLAGTRVVAVVVVGRVIDPDFNEVRRALWAAVSRARFSFDVCCLEPPENGFPGDEDPVSID